MESIIQKRGDDGNVAFGLLLMGHVPRLIEEHELRSGDALCERLGTPKGDQIRLTSQLPPIHVALVGRENIIRRLSDLAVFLELLPRSGT